MQDEAFATFLFSYKPPLEDLLILKPRIYKHELTEMVVWPELHLFAQYYNPHYLLDANNILQVSFSWNQEAEHHRRECWLMLRDCHQWSWAWQQRPAIPTKAEKMGAANPSYEQSRLCSQRCCTYTCWTIWIWYPSRLLHLPDNDQ